MRKIWANGSFAYLLGQYGFEFNQISAIERYYGDNPSASGYNTRKTPMFYAATGIMLTVDGRGMLAMGVGGVYWSSTASLQVYLATEYVVDVNDVTPSAFDSRYYGNSLRYQRSHNKHIVAKNRTKSLKLGSYYR